MRFSNLQILTLLTFLTTSCSPLLWKVGQLPEKATCIAVLPFESRYDASGKGEILSEFLALDLYSKGAQGVIGPQEVKDLFIQAHDPLPSVIDPYWAREVGKKLKVDAVIFGSILRMPMLSSGTNRPPEVQVQFDAYLMDTANGEVKWSFGVRQVLMEEDYISYLSHSSDGMSRSLLVDRSSKVFGQSHCWKIPPTIDLQAVTPVPTATATAPAKPILSLSQQMIAKTLDSIGGFTLDPSIFVERSDHFTKNAVLALRELAQGMLGTDPKTNFRIEGHVDTSNDISIDLRLSKLRAQAIRNYLVKQGVAEKRLVAIGSGSSKPLVPNINRLSRTQNRRTEIKKDKAQDE